MPIYLHAYHLLIRKETLDEKYQGGIVQFKKDFEFDANEFNQEDEELISICSLKKNSFDTKLLKKRGLEWDEEDGEIYNSYDFNLVELGGKILWFSAYVPLNAVFTDGENIKSEHWLLADYISKKLSVKQMSLLRAFSEFPHLTINQESYSTLKNEVDNPYILIQRKIEFDFEQNYIEEDFEEYPESEWNKYHIRIPTGYLAELHEYPEYLFLDEREGFKPDENYLTIKTECNKHLGLIRDEKGIYNINESNLSTFIKSGETLNKKLLEIWNFKAYNEFRWIYMWSVSWMHYFLISERAAFANSKLNPYNQDDIEDWLADYNRLYFCNGPFLGTIEFETIDEEIHLYKSSMENDYKIYLQGKALTECIRFKNQYDEYLEEHGVVR